MAKFIPGSWKVTPGYDVRAVADDRFVASVFGRGKEEKEATAQLIAAAPEMLEYIRHALVYVEAEEHPFAKKIAQSIREIIAKAEGTEVSRGA